MTPEEAREKQAHYTSSAGQAGVPIALLILALLCGAGSLVFVVFGVWPGALLLLVALILGVIAKKRLQKAST